MEEEEDFFRPQTDLPVLVTEDNDWDEVEEQLDAAQDEGTLHPPPVITENLPSTTSV